MSRYVAAIDQGTTSTRCILFDRSGPVVSAQKEHRQLFPQPGWVEHDPLEIWQRTQEVVGEAMQVAGATGADIVAVGIANQRETTVVWDRETGQPYGNAIVWQDTRTAEICRQLEGDVGPNRYRGIVGLPLATYFAGPKQRWILKNVPGVREAADAGRALFGTIDSWLIWHLTGGTRGGRHLTDVTNASRTMLMNLRTLAWDRQMLDALEIPEQMLPAIAPSMSRERFGETRADGPFGAAVPIGGVLGDQQAALVGQSCFAAGESKNTYGTGCFMLLHTGQTPVESRNGLLTTVAYQVDRSPAAYALEGSVAVAGSLVQWVRDNLGLIERSPDIERLAATVSDNGGVYCVPAFSGLFAPYWRPDARGLIAGLTGYANKGHLARAVLEATAYQTRDVLEAMRSDSGLPLAVLRVDGGMTANELLMQFQANILGVPVVRPKVTETTALGAAYAAGVAVGFWNGLDDLRGASKADKIWTPDMPDSERQSLCAGWRKAVDRSMNWV